MTTARVNGVTLHYEVEGEGPPLLLIAGLGARLQVLPRGSHGMAIEYTPETVNAVVAFLNAPA